MPESPLSALWGSVEIDPEPDADAESQKRQRQDRTANARAAALAARRQRKQDLVESKVQEQVTDSRQGLLQKTFFTRSLFNPGSSYNQDYSKRKLDRARCVYSCLQVLVKTIQSLFQPGHPEHVINCIIADDTTVRFKPSSGRSQIYTICNTVQTLHVRQLQADPDQHCQDPLWQTIPVPSPLVVLGGAKAGDVHGGMTAFAVQCAHGVGMILEKVGLVPDSVAIPTGSIRTQIFVGDALKANDAAWGVERHEIKKKKKELQDCGAPPLNTLALRVKCLVHQTNLIRKPCILSVKGHWSCLVRLAHMFEQASFRKSFGGAMIQVLQEDGFFQRALA